MITETTNSIDFMCLLQINCIKLQGQARYSFKFQQSIITSTHGLTILIIHYKIWCLIYHDHEQWIITEQAETVNLFTWQVHWICTHTHTHTHNASPTGQLFKMLVTFTRWQQLLRINSSETWLLESEQIKTYRAAAGRGPCPCQDHSLDLSHKHDLFSEKDKVICLNLNTNLKQT